MDELINVLSKSVSPDKEELRVVELFLKQAATSNLSEFLKELSNVISKPELPVHIRMAAGLQIKNQLTSKESFTKTAYHKRWLEIPSPLRQFIKQNVVKAISLEGTRPSVAAQCAAYIAVAEMPNNLWPELIPYLVQTITDSTSPISAIEGSLDALGYICQEIDPRILNAQSNEILTAIIHGMKNENLFVKSSATNALLNSLEFTSANFNYENERNYIMTVVCEATQSPETNIQICAMQCLVKIMSLYYQYMEAYMKTALFTITLNAMSSDVDEISLQGIEFWSTVCDEEIYMSLQESSTEDVPKSQPFPNQIPLRSNKNYAKGALPYIVPILLETLTKQDENSDEDDWNPFKAASVCLMLMANCCGDEIVQHTLGFITQNIFNTMDWRYRDGAIMAFGCIIDGPTPELLKAVVEEALPHIVPMIKDPIITVRDTASWTLSRICEYLPEVVLSPNILNPLLNALVENLTAEPKIAVNICGALSSIVQTAYDRAIDHANPADSVNFSPNTFLLSSQYEVVIERLLLTADRNDGIYTNLRGAAYQTLADWLKCCPLDRYYVLQKITTHILAQLKQVIQMLSVMANSQNGDGEHLESSNQLQYLELQTNLCCVLQSSLKKLKFEDLSQISDMLMTALLQMLTVGGSAKSSSNAGVYEDILMTISAFIEGYGERFTKYLDAFIPFLIVSLSYKDIYQVSMTAIMLVIDLYRNLGRSLIPYTERILGVMIQQLADNSVDINLKPHIFSAISEIALFLGNSFAPYATSILKTLDQACTFKLPTTTLAPLPSGSLNVGINGLPEPDKTGTAGNGTLSQIEIDESMIEYLNSLRTSCLEAYTGILHGLSATNLTSSNEPHSLPDQSKIDLVYPYVNNIMQFVVTIAKDIESSQSLRLSAFNLIGDMCQIFGSKMKQFFDNNSPYASDLNKFYESIHKLTLTKKDKESIKWAQRQIKQIKNS